MTTPKGNTMKLTTIQPTIAVTVTRKNVEHINNHILPNLPTKHRYLPNNRTKVVLGDILISTRVKIVIPTPEGELSQIIRVRWVMGKGQFRRRFDRVRHNGHRGVYRVIEKTS